MTISKPFLLENLREVIGKLTTVAVPGSSETP
jgi:hypothetical protein